MFSRHTSPCIALFAVLFTTSCVSATQETTLLTKDTSGQHTLLIAREQSPVGESFDFKYVLKGKTPSCQATISGHARKLTKKELEQIDSDWTEYLPNGEAVRIARYTVEPEKRIELELDVQSHSPRFAMFAAPLPQALKGKKCLGTAETIEILFFQ